MKITAALKAFLIEKKWLAADADDDAARKCVGEKIKSGELTSDKLAELTKDNVPNGKALIGSEVKSQLDAALGPINATLKAITDKLGTPAPTNGTPPSKPPETETEVGKAVQLELTKLGMGELLAKHAPYLQTNDIQHKEAVDSYTHNRTAALHVKDFTNETNHVVIQKGSQVVIGNKAMDLQSQRDKAISAAYFKWALERNSDLDMRRVMPKNLRMTDHDKQLLGWSLRNSRWQGVLNGICEDDSGAVAVNDRKLTDFEVKGLLDDTQSGGIEIAPIEFDDAVITIPVLYGELFPLVEVVNVTRGRRMKGAALQNPTFTWGTAEGTGITPFNTNAFISPYDTPIFPITSAIEIGLDFEEDSPPNIGSFLVTQYGMKMQEQLDFVIPSGDGISQPQGIFNSTAPNVLHSDMGSGGPPTIGDYEQLLFGVSKAFRQAKGSRNAFFASDTSYRRARAIPVGPGDERRVLGMDHQAYTVMDVPYKIQVSIPNAQIGFANFGYYRMYRRLGLNVRMETAGYTLATKNTKLLVLRARYGGSLTLGGAAAVMKDAWAA